MAEDAWDPEDEAWGPLAGNEGPEYASFIGRLDQLIKDAKKEDLSNYGYRTLRIARSYFWRDFVKRYPEEANNPSW